LPVLGSGGRGAPSAGRAPNPGRHRLGIADDMLSLSGLPRINVAEMRQSLLPAAPAGATCRQARSSAPRTRRPTKPCPFERSAPLVSVGCVACLPPIVERQGQGVSAERCAIAASYVRASGDGSTAAAGLLRAPHEHATCPYGRLVPSEVEVIPLSPSLIRKPRL